ncbi:MAG: hypothetical protein ACKVS6_04570 [Planctomycetota bacterium]
MELLLLISILRGNAAQITTIDVPTYDLDNGICFEHNKIVCLRGQSFVIIPPPYETAYVKDTTISHAKTCSDPDDALIVGGGAPGEIIMQLNCRNEVLIFNVDKL